MEGVAELVCPPFSNTTTIEDIAQKITIMDICKNYFDYKCMTMCGFPEITLEGTDSDWRMLKEQYLYRVLIKKQQSNFTSKPSFV